jgi:hypothetical protein
VRTLNNINVEDAAAGSPQIVEVKEDAILLHCEIFTFAHLIYLDLTAHTHLSLKQRCFEIRHNVLKIFLAGL